MFQFPRAFCVRNIVNNFYFAAHTESDPAPAAIRATVVGGGWGERRREMSIERRRYMHAKYMDNNNIIIYNIMSSRLLYSSVRTYIYIII